MASLKNEQLVEVARLGNVAQFISFDPAAQPRHARIAGFPDDERFASLDDAVAALLTASPEQSVNVRAYSPDSPKGNEFLYGLKQADETAGHVRRLAGDGAFMEPSRRNQWQSAANRQRARTAETSQIW